MTQLGLDAGATRTKWSLAQDGEIIARGDAAALTGHVFTEAQIQHARDCLAEVRDGVRRAARDSSVQAVVAGVTGLGEGETAARTMNGLIAEGFGLPPRAVAVRSDLWLTYRAYHEPGEGILLYAGTGSIAYHQDAQGRVVRAGGYGFLLGDEGGALWTVLEAFRRLLRERDEGREEDSVLARLLAGALGDLDWPTIREFAYGQARGHIAALGPLVSDAASQGDPIASAVQEQGARELARLAACVARQAPQAGTVTVSGGAISERTYQLVSAELAAGGLRVQRGSKRASDANALLRLEE